MRFEPANAKYFQTEIASGDSLFNAIQLIGCFSTHPDHAKVDAKVTEPPSEMLVDLFRSAFSSDLELVAQHRQVVRSQHPDLDPRLFYACVVLRMLYDMAIDGYEKHGAVTVTTTTSSVSTGISSSSSRSSESEERMDSYHEAGGGRRKPVPSLNLLPPPPEPVIVHPSIVNVMLQLLPTLRSAEKDQEGHDGLDVYTIALQTFMSEVIQSLLRNEKNQQLMCDVEFLSKILVICKAALEDDNHLLNSPFQYLLERLAAQKLESFDLKTFLRLGHPLACLNHEERTHDSGNIVPLTRIKVREMSCIYLV